MRTSWKVITVIFAVATLCGMVTLGIHLQQTAEPASFSMHGFKGVALEVMGSADAFVEARMPAEEYSTKSSDWVTEGVLTYKNDSKRIYVNAWRLCADTGKFEHVSCTFNPHLPWMQIIGKTEIKDGSIVAIPRRGRFIIFITALFEILFPFLVVMITARKARWIQY